MIEKLIEMWPYRGGLKITAGKKNTQNSPKTENLGLFHMVPVIGLEPIRCRQRWILSPLRLPFHHTGLCAYIVYYILCEIARKKFTFSKNMKYFTLSVQSYIMQIILYACTGGDNPYER